MKLKKGILAGAIALIIAGMSTVTYAGQKEICGVMWDDFQEMRKMTGLMEASDDQFGKMSQHSQRITEQANKSNETEVTDANYKVLNGEVVYHADKIVQAADNQDLEEFQVQFRRLTIACRNCHKIYRSEQNLVP